LKCRKHLQKSAPSSAQNGQALEEAEKIKRERGDDFCIVWQLGYGPKDAQYQYHLSPKLDDSTPTNLEVTQLCSVSCLQDSREKENRPVVFAQTQ
jgi:hypothetical protein